MKSVSLLNEMASVTAQKFCIFAESTEITVQQNTLSVTTEKRGHCEYDEIVQFLLIVGGGLNILSAL